MQNKIEMSFPPDEKFGKKCVQINIKKFCALYLMPGGHNSYRVGRKGAVML